MTDASAVDAALLLLRLVAGLGLAFHGYAKVARGGRLTGTARWFDSIGMHPGRIHAVVAAGTELGAGLLLAVGLFTPLAGAAFVGLMLVAAYTVHRGHGFLITNQGWEYNLVLATIAVTLATVGPGRWSFDYAVGVADDISGWTGLTTAVVLGGVGGVLQLVVFFRPTPQETT